MRIPDEQGRTRVKVLKLWSERTGKTHSDLVAPEFPVALEYVWRWFEQLTGGSVMQPALSWAEIHAWAAVTSRRLALWEIEVLMRLNSETRGIWAEHQAKSAPTNKVSHDRHRPARR